MSHIGYPSYKDTGTPWLGAIPNHWDIKPLWSMFKRQKRTGHESERLLSVYRDYGVIPKDSRDDNANKASEDLSTYQLVKPGDLAINKMKAWQGSVAISTIQGIVSPAYFIFTPTHHALPKYLHYLFRCTRYIAGYLAISKGVRVGQWDMDPDHHSRMPVVIPPRKEQEEIADFLDREISRIDSLIEKKTRFIELLKEKRQAVVTQAVTKGLNSRAPMVDSGVEWLGLVPVHWKILRCSSFLFEIKRKNDLMQSENYLSLMANRGVLPYAEKGDVGNKKPEDLSKCKLVEVGDFVINSMNYSIGSYGRSNHRGICSPVYVILRHKKNLVESDYVDLILSNSSFQQYAQSFGTGILDHRRAIGWDEIKKISVGLPPIQEQIEISQKIHRETKKISLLIKKTEESIGLLREHRSTLITAAVTGKIDVRKSK